MTIMPAMKDVLRLTKAGRLAEATALLRGGWLGENDKPSPPSRDDGLDFIAPTKAGGAWTMPAEAGSAEIWPVETGIVRPMGGRFEWRETVGATGRRRFKLYVPAGEPRALRPLVLMLHGCTQSPDDFAIGTGMNALADEVGFLVAYPEQTAAHNSSKCWNWFKQGDQRRGGGEAALLAGIVDDVASDLAVDTGRVFVAGLSAGGAAAAILAREYPDVFRAAGVHSGLACGAAHDLPSAMAAMKRGASGRLASSVSIPTITFHGSADRTVNPANARHVLADAIAGLSAPSVERGRSPGGTGYTREIWRDGRGGLRAEAWTLEGAGHAWSGGSLAGSYTDPRGPDASRAMLRFFLDV